MCRRHGRHTLTDLVCTFLGHSNLLPMERHIEWHVGIPEVPVLLPLAWFLPP